MKCVYTRDIDACMVTMPAGEDLSAILYRPDPDRNGKPIPYWPKGTVREVVAPVCDAAWYCRMGIAEPFDEECAAALNYTPEQMAAAKHRYQRLVDGIHPDDFEVYDAGVMIGYAPNGSWIPGPNFDKWQVAKTAEKEKRDI